MLQLIVDVWKNRMNRNEKGEKELGEDKWKWKEYRWFMQKKFARGKCDKIDLVKLNAGRVSIYPIHRFYAMFSSSAVAAQEEEEQEKTHTHTHADNTTSSLTKWIVHASMETKREKETTEFNIHSIYLIYIRINKREREKYAREGREKTSVIFLR